MSYRTITSQNSCSDTPRCSSEDAEPDSISIASFWRPPVKFPCSDTRHLACCIIKTSRQSQVRSGYTGDVLQTLPVFKRHQHVADATEMLNEPELDHISSESLFLIPALSTESDSQWQCFQFDNRPQCGLFHLSDATTQTLPSLEPLSFSLELPDITLPSLEPNDISSQASGSSEREAEEEILTSDTEDEPDDIWRTLAPILEERLRNQLTSWDHFQNAKHQEPRHTYLSEVNAPWFDALRAEVLKKRKREGPRCVKTKVLINGLYDLGMGRDSVLFRWNSHEHRFVSQVDEITSSGCSGEVLHSLVVACGATGLNTKTILDHIEVSSKITGGTSPGRAALYAAANSCLYALHQYLERRRSNVVSLIQLQNVWHDAGVLVHVLKELSHAVSGSLDDGGLLSMLLRLAADISAAHPALNSIMQEIVKRTCQPATERLRVEIGLPCATSAATYDVDCQFVAKDQPWSTFLPLDISLVVAEAARSLELLKMNDPDCVLLRRRHTEEGEKLSFEVSYSWEMIRPLQARANEYERELKDAILNLDAASHILPHRENMAPGILECTGADSLETVDQIFQLDSRLFETHDCDSGRSVSDHLQIQVDAYLGGATATFSPLELAYNQAFSLSLSPLIFAQHRLLSYSVLRLLFLEHNLIGHLKVQQRLQLLEDGLFASRLSIALFDPDQTSGEGLRRDNLGTGLRLQNRDQWPPASSELRLVLMGILSDSMALSEERALNDSVSFAIRDLSDDDLERCRDINSIHALDFLRLQYKAPSQMLECVLTPASLDKLDRIFQHLLRLLRVKTVAQALLRDVCKDGKTTRSTAFATHKFRVEIQHFVLSLADYCQNVATRIPWQRFKNLVREIQSCLSDGKYEETLSLAQGLDHLRSLYERTLDEVLYMLHLKRKQAEGRNILEDIFGIVLRFAASQRSRPRKTMSPGEDAENDESTTRRLHEDFRKKVRRFLSGLHTDQQRNAPTVDLRSENINMFEYLTLRLDMFGYWTENKGSGEAAGTFDAI